MSQIQSQPELSESSQPSAIGLRAVLVGGGLAAFLSWLSAFSVNVVKGTTITEDHNAVGAVALLFLVVVCGNGLAKLFERWFDRTAVPAAGLLGLAGVALIWVLGSYSAGMADGVGKKALQVVLSLMGLGWGSFALIAVARLMEWPLRPGRYVAMSQSELLTSFAMMLLATAVCTVGLSMILPQIITTHTYFATAENRWSVLIDPYVPDWLAVRDEQAVKQFYEGLGVQGASIGYVLRNIPWMAWLPCLGYWAIFALSLYFTSMCMMVILRRQWIEKEILIYPLTRVPMEITAEPEHQVGQPRRALTPVVRNPLMWLGFAVPFAIFSFRGLGAHFTELFGQLGQRQGQWQDAHWWIIITFCLFAALVVSLISDARKAVFIGLLLIFHLSVYQLLDNTVNIILYPSFAMLAFVYLINLDVSFSLWWFAILALMVKGILIKLGITWTESLTGYGVSGAPRLYHAELGAMFVFVFYGLWIARRHLLDVVRKAVGAGRDVDDSDEIMSYRVAFFGMVLGLIVMAVWLNKSGLSWPVTLFFLMTAMVIFLGLSRVVAEGGLACCVAPAIAPEFAMSKIGAAAIGPAGLVALSFTYMWAADIRVFVMAEAATGLKLAQGVRKGRRRIFWAFVVAILVSIVISMGTVMVLSYRDGGLNLEDWYYRSGPARPFQFYSDKINTIDRVHRTERDVVALQRELQTETDEAERVRTTKRIDQKQAQLAKEKKNIVPYKKGWAASGVGAAIMAGLILLRNAVVAWPLHPIGLPMAGTWLMDWLWLPIFLAWLIKEVVLRYGGPTLYRRSIPFFLGMIVGQFCSGLLWLVIDYFTGLSGSELFRF